MTMCEKCGFLHAPEEKCPTLLGRPVIQTPELKGLPLATCEHCGTMYGTHEQSVAYHETKTCLRMRRRLSVIEARARNGVTDHTGLAVDGLEVNEQTEWEGDSDEGGSLR